MSHTAVGVVTTRTCGEVGGKNAYFIELSVKAPFWNTAEEGTFVILMTAETLPYEELAMAKKDAAQLSLWGDGDEA